MKPSPTYMLLALLCSTVAGFGQPGRASGSLPNATYNGKLLPSVTKTVPLSYAVEVIACLRIAKPRTAFCDRKANLK
jgi:hypothetical protein